MEQEMEMKEVEELELNQMIDFDRYGQSMKFVMLEDVVLDFVYDFDNLFLLYLCSD